MELGKSNFGGKQEFKKKNKFKFDKETNVIIARILPPMGNLASKGVWSRFHVGVFGYKNMEGKHRPFESTLVEKSTWVDGKKHTEVVVKDAALERMYDLKDKLEKAKQEGNTALVAKLNSLVGFKGVYSEARNHHMNVVLLDGRIGELSIKHKCKKALDDEIKKLNANGVDPTSVENGRFFVFTRSGIGNDTIFKVEVCKEKVNVPGMGMMERDMVHALTPEIISRLESEAYDLDDIYPRITPEECAQIVNESNFLSGRSPACDRIFDARWKANRNQNQASEPNPFSNQLPPVQQTAPAPVAAPVQTPAAPTASTSSQAQVNAIVGGSLPLGSIQAPVQQTALAPAPAVAQNTAVEELSDEDFFKSIGVEV